MGSLDLALRRAAKLYAGRIIRLLRENAGKSRPALAGETNFSTTRLGRIETGRACLTPAEVARLSAALARHTAGAELPAGQTASNGAPARDAELGRA